MTVAVLLLAAAIGIEVGSTALLPRADGFTEPLWSSVVLVGYGISIWLLAVVVRTIPFSVAYAVWSGAGTAVVAVIGYLLLGESLGPLKIMFLLLIIVGVVGLNVAGSR
jgi:small multidrug resistance pump